MRLWESHIYMMSHHLLGLSVHEPGQETIYFTSATMEAKRRRIAAGTEDTKFSGWLEAFFENF